MFVENDIKYLDLLEKIWKELNLDWSLTYVKILFDAKMDRSKGIRIETDSNVAVYMYLIKNSEESKKCPLLVEIEEKWVNLKGVMVSRGDIEMYAKITSSNLRDTTMVDGEGIHVHAKSTSWSLYKVATTSQEVQSLIHMLPNTK